jgi:hypothetical protein
MIWEIIVEATTTSLALPPSVMGDNCILIITVSIELVIRERLPMRNAE